MSDQDVELVRKICELHARGEYKAASKFIHRKMNWHHHHGFEDYPDERTYKNYERVVRYLQEFCEAWDEFSLEPQQYFDVGDDRVITLLRVHGRGKGSGVLVERRFAEIWSVRNGKAVYYELWRFPNMALESAGVAAHISD